MQYKLCWMIVCIIVWEISSNVDLNHYNKDFWISILNTKWKLANIDAIRILNKPILITVLWYSVIIYPPFIRPTSLWVLIHMNGYLQWLVMISYDREKNADCFHWRRAEVRSSLALPMSPRWRRAGGVAVLWTAVHLLTSYAADLKESERNRVRLLVLRNRSIPLLLINNN